ncbi:MAG: 3-oxoadipate enol-lactonase [Burkholderiaceae bacterium]
MNARVTVNGTELNTRIDGPDNAPWLVLSNSLASNLHMWDTQIPWLSRHFRVLRYDTRGHGASATPPGPYHFDDLVADVIGLMDRHAIEDARFMGLSMGGMTALGLALAHPGRFKGLICCAARADGPEGFAAMWDQRIAQVRDQGMGALVQGTLERWLTEGFRQREPAETDRIGAMIRDTDPAGYIGCAQAIQRLDYLRHLDHVSVPLLYVGGEVDAGAMPDVMQAMADRTPGGRFHMIPNAAHIVNIDNPTAFNAAIAPFLGIGLD